MPPSPTGSAASDASWPLLVEDLTFGWGTGHPALKGCNLCIPHAGLWMLVGSNGSGKSTLLRLVSGLLQPDTGRIHMPLKPALVFQNPDHQLLLPSCASDLQLGLPPGLGADERRRRLRRALAQVGLEGLENRPIHTLSGGQKQRLAIAGALASEATLLLLDEPTALLDPTSQREVLGLIRGLCSRADRPLTALWITHRLEELDQCDGAARMENGHIGPWLAGPELRRALTPLPAGRAEG
ncbi:MAG: ABC transporter ATP-binding protein [Synechococcaceae cyanobacterium]|jgi:energy-coupling factor transport system ATP-binding protein